MSSETGADLTPGAVSDRSGPRAGAGFLPALVVSAALGLAASPVDAFPPSAGAGRGAQADDGDRLQSDGMSPGASATAALPRPASTSPTADELVEMSREERVRALRGRSWEMVAAPADPDMELDGWLDEPAWESAVPIGDFYQRESFEGLPSSETTVVRALYDRENLYFGFYCTLEDAENNRPRTMFRDENIAADDAVAIMIDAYNDQRSAVFLATNANGIVFDMLQNGERPNTRNLDWDAIWEARGRYIPGGWVVEVRVPFKSLRFEAPRDGEAAVFGIGFKRNIPMKNEEVYWPFVPNDSTWYRPAELGKLTNLEGIAPGGGVEIRPYALGGLSGGDEHEGETGNADGGFDVKWGLTPGLSADFTFNTDFAQEEVDDLQINFTRFSLRFPERRQIFLEGQRNFQFGERRDADLVFTRRIGLAEGGAPVPILGGGRLSGRHGAYTVGLLGMATGESEALPGERFAVARVRRDVFSRSTVGALFTSRSHENGSNRVAGVDANMYFGDGWAFEGLWARVFDDAGPSAGADLASGRLEYEVDRIGGTAKFIQIGEAFDPGVGFVPRKGIRKVYLSGRVSPRPAAPWLRQVHLETNLNRTADLEDVVQTRRATLRGRATLETGDELRLEMNDVYEYTPAAFSITDVTIPEGGYPFRRYEIGINTYRRRYASVGASYEFGGFWGGTRREWSGNVNYRINRNLGVRGSYEYNQVRLPWGDFDTRLVASRLRVAFRSDLVLLGLFQYNDASGDLAANVRFNWIPKPGTDVFVVYTEFDEWGDVFVVKNRSLSVKLNYLFRL